MSKYRSDRWYFYKDGKQEWRWRRKATNGRIVGAAHEGYKNKEDCIQNAVRAGYSDKTWLSYVVFWLR